MTQYEQEFLKIMPRALKDIAKELKKMNKLKALELKGRHLSLDITPEQIDDIMEGRD